MVLINSLDQETYAIYFQINMNEFAKFENKIGPRMTKTRAKYKPYLDEPL